MLLTMSFLFCSSRPDIEGCLSHSWFASSPATTTLRVSTPSSSPLLTRRTASPTTVGASGDNRSASPVIRTHSPRLLPPHPSPTPQIGRGGNSNNKENKLRTSSPSSSPKLTRSTASPGRASTTTRKAQTVVQQPVHIPKRRGADNIEGGPLTKNVTLSPRLTRHSIESAKR